MKRGPALALLLACALLPAVADEKTPSAKTSARPEVVDLVLLGDGKLARVRVRFEIDGKPVPELWDAVFDKLFAFQDRNGDGSLDEKEADRLPSPFAIRQVMWGQPAPYSGPAIPFADLDANGDKKVSRDELAAFYRKTGLGTVLVGVGQPPATEALTDAILKALDTDGDKKVSEAEWKAAPEVLRKLDRNDDELVGPGELVPKVAYPGAAGSLLLTPPSPTTPLHSELDGLPVVLLPESATDLAWAKLVLKRADANNDGGLDVRETGFSDALFAKLDADNSGRLSEAELSAWRSAEPDATWTVRLGTKSAEKPVLETSPSLTAAFPVGRLRFDIRADEGKAPTLATNAGKRTLDRFGDADADGDGVVVADDLKKPTLYEIRQLLPVADRNADGKLSREEASTWVDVQTQIAKCHAMLTLLDHRAGLFEVLDADHDGSLSVPELGVALDRVKASGVWKDGQFDRALLPRHLIVTASRGHPVAALGAPRRDGPAWFRAMDRNGDGYVSRREFTGGDEKFRSFDLNGDGFLDPDEASKVPSK